MSAQGGGKTPPVSFDYLTSLVTSLRETIAQLNYVY